MREKIPDYENQILTLEFAIKMNGLVVRKQVQDKKDVSVPLLEDIALYKEHAALLLEELRKVSLVVCDLTQLYVAAQEGSLDGVTGIAEELRKGEA